MNVGNILENFGRYGCLIMEFAEWIRDGMGWDEGRGKAEDLRYIEVNEKYLSFR